MYDEQKLGSIEKKKCKEENTLILISSFTNRYLFSRGKFKYIVKLKKYTRRTKKNTVKNTWEVV